MESERRREPGPDPARVTVAVCNFQGEQHLPPCLEALLAQTLPADEILVVDNASTDASERLVRERFPCVRWIAMGANAGPCPARNTALRAARNRWVLLVDNDAVLAPDALERLVGAARDRPGAALLQPRSVFASEPERVHYDGGGCHYLGLISLRNFHVPLAAAEGNGTLAVDVAVSVVLLADRELVLEAGGFDASYFILFEDLDLSYRLRLAGRTILSVEEALVHHRGGTAGISFRGPGTYPRRRAFLHSRNRWIFLLKCYRWRTLLAAGPGLLLYELAWALFCLASGGFGGWLAGKLDFARQLPDTLRKRVLVARTRVLRDRDLLVGGPLTISAQLRSRDGQSRSLRWLDACLRGWWTLARRLSG